MTIVRCAAGLAAVISAMLVQGTVVGPLCYPVPVSLPLLVVVGVAVLCGPSTGIALGFGAGLLADLTANHPVGLLALTWLGAGVVGGIVGGLVESHPPTAPRTRSARAWLAAIRRPTTSVEVSRPRAQLAGPAGTGPGAERRAERRTGREAEREARSAARRAARDRRHAHAHSGSSEPSPWRGQGMVTGVVAGAATATGLVLVAAVGGNGGLLPAQLVQIIPATLIDAVLAVPVLALARPMLASAALRPVLPLRVGTIGSAPGRPTPDRPMEVR